MSGIATTGMTIIKQDPEYWIQKTMEHLTPDVLRKDIETGQNPFLEHFNSKYLKLEAVQNKIRGVLNANWQIIEFYFLSPTNLKNKICEDADKVEIMNTDEGVRWLNNVSEQTHAFLREFTYKEMDTLLKLLKQQEVMVRQELFEIMEAVGVPKDRVEKFIDELIKRGIVVEYVKLNREMVSND